MRILMLSDFYPPQVRGGLEHHVDSLASELTERGHDIHVATLSGAARPSHPRVTLHTVKTAASALVKHADTARPFHPPLPDPCASRQLAKLVAAVRPDVIHGHSWLAVSLPRSSRAPLVFTAHDYGMVCQLRTLFTTSGEVCTGPKAACVRCGAGRYGVTKSALMTAGTVAGRRWLRPQAFITLSTAVARALDPHVTQPIVTIPGFLPSTSQLPPQPPAAGLPPQPYVMYAGDPGEYKGLEDLIELWEAAEPPKAHLLIASTKPLDRRLPAGCSVAQLTRQEVAAAWQRAAVAVVPSRWPEPFGMVALEAMAAGTPVVASAIGGLADIVRDGRDGYLVAPGRPRDLRDRIDRLLADAPLRMAFSESARGRAAEFSADEVIPQFEQLYHRVLAPEGRESQGVSH